MDGKTKPIGEELLQDQKAQPIMVVPPEKTVHRDLGPLPTIAERLYALKLHQVISGVNEIAGTEGTTEVIRVPGGWLYMTYVSGTVTSTFVPFDNEFQD